MFPPSANDIRDERCRYERGGKNQFGKIEDVPRYIINGTVPAPPAQISGNGVIEKVIHVVLSSENDKNSAGKSAKGNMYRKFFRIYFIVAIVYFIISFLFFYYTP